RPRGRGGPRAGPGRSRRRPRSPPGHRYVLEGEQVGGDKGCQRARDMGRSRARPPDPRLVLEEAVVADQTLDLQAGRREGGAEAPAREDPEVRAVANAAVGVLPAVDE